MNQLPADEAVVFVDAVHPTHAVRPVGCWAPQETLVAVEQSSGRNRLNIHGAIDLETGQTIMKDVLTADACSNRDQHVPANHRCWHVLLRSLTALNILRAM
jgi:hypothetical protein